MIVLSDGGIVPDGGGNHIIVPLRQNACIVSEAVLSESDGPVSTLISIVESVRR